MSTVFDYLEQIRQENPQYRHKSNVSLYKELRDQDTNMPSWHSIDNVSKQRQRIEKGYESKQNPGFINSLFDWTDWGIDEGSWRWAKMAYNQSITGLSYQLYNG